MSIAWTIGHWTGTFLAIVCSILVVAKCVWNFGLPYAMLLSKERRGWSTFPLIELVPLFLALGIAWATELRGWLSVGTLAKLGFGIVIASYLHFCFVSLLYGVRHKSANPTDELGDAADKEP